MGSIDKLVEMSHRVAKYTVGAEGNTSAREGDFFYIKASGYDLRSLNEQHIIKCDLNGKQVDNFDLRPSIEAEFHSLIYGLTDCSYIAHTHPVETLKILCSKRIEKFATERLFPDQVVFNGLESCVVEYAHPGPSLKQGMEEALRGFFLDRGYFPDLTLLQNHGIVCASNSIRNCIFATEICEKAASIFASTKTKDLIFLTDEQKNKIFTDKKEKLRRM
jgi:ribulose-5-phosphate 4-epimerase/fuculose-1-phosphate aldolase